MIPPGGELPLPGQGEVPVDPERVGDDEGPIGIFPSWGWLYATVVAWCAVLVLLLWIFTVTFDYGGR